MHLGFQTWRATDWIRSAIRLANKMGFIYWDKITQYFINDVLFLSVKLRFNAIKWMRYFSLVSVSTSTSILYLSLRIRQLQNSKHHVGQVLPDNTELFTKEYNKCHPKHINVSCSTRFFIIMYGDLQIRVTSLWFHYNAIKSSNCATLVFHHYDIVYLNSVYSWRVANSMKFCGGIFNSTLKQWLWQKYTIEYCNVLLLV